MPLQGTNARTIPPLPPRMSMSHCPITVTGSFKKTHIRVLLHTTAQLLDLVLRA